MRLGDACSGAVRMKLGVKTRYVGLALGALIVVGAALALPSCGHDQKLVSIAVTPTTVTYLSPTAVPASFKAYGTYIHPPATKDITQQATWSTDVPALLILSYQSGVGEEVAPNSICGVANLWATASEGTGGAANIVVSAPSTLTINNPSDPTCPGGGTEGTLSVEITPANSGTVISSTYGINCPSVSCIAVVPVGGTVALTATPNSGFSFLNWEGCTQGGGTNPSCLVTIPTGGIGLVATFQPN
jgi:Divergent InlB B-repeat domain